MPMQFSRTLIFTLLLFPVAGMAAPHVLYTDIVTGPNTGGEGSNGAYLTIFGNGFGTSGTVTINNVSVARVVQWSDTKITVQPGSAVTSGPIKVNSGGSDSNTDRTFTVVSGKIFFVSLSGNDSTCVAGDITKPCRTVQTTLDRSDFGPGDHLVIRGGTWSDTFDHFGSFWSVYGKSGTAAAPFVIMGYPSENANFVRTNQTRGFHAYNTTGHYVIANLHLDANGSGLSIGLEPGTDDIRVVNNEVKNFWENSGGSAAIDGSGRQFRIFGNLVHDNGGSKLYHALYFDGRDTRGATDIEIAYNTIYNQKGGRGIQIYGDTGVQITNVRIHHNLIHDIALDGILFARDTATGMKAYNNVVYRTANPSMRGFTNDEGSSGGCIRLDSVSNPPATDAEIYNNTFVDCALDGDTDSGGFRFGGAARLVARNNLVVGKYYSGTPPTNNTVSNNLWFGSGAAPSFDTSALATVDPLFVDISVKNYHLQSLSPAIDMGFALNGIVTDDFDGNVRPQGGAYDIGAFESTGTTLPAPQDLQIKKN